MPKSIVFTTHPESHGKMRYDYLEKPILPAKEKGRGHKKPTIHWFNVFIEKCECIAKRDFSWEFAYYIYCQHGDEDSEFVSRWSVPLWFVTIRNENGNVIHPKLEIAFDTDGDIEFRRMLTETEKEIRYDFLQKAEERAIDFIREYARLHPLQK